MMCALFCFLSPYVSRGFSSSKTELAVDAIKKKMQLALTQYYKVTAKFLRYFTFRMGNDQPWTTHNASFNV